MELKCPPVVAGSNGTASSNRTFMELKFACALDIPGLVCSNRTFMELKLDFYHPDRCSSKF